MRGRREPRRPRCSYCVLFPPAFLARNAREAREVFTMSAFAAQCRDAREPACTARYGTRIAQSAPPEFRVRAQRR